MERFDLIVIGGGPAGYRGAEMAGKAGLKVLLIEKENIGGVCLNEGCVPSKAFLHSAKIKDAVNGGAESGVLLEGSVRIDQAQVVKYKDKVVKRLIVGVKASLKGSGVNVVSGQGYIAGKEGDSFLVQVGEEKYIGEKLLIASGSSPLIPGIEGLKEGYQKGYVLTNREALSLTEIPEKLVVIGGGVIGLELGSYYAMAGSKVTVVEMLPNIGGPMDEEISGILRKSLEKKGVQIETSAKVIKVGEREVFF
ncbi:MAG: FAD-dependent oxidoreductase, partial [Clostridiales bacterium]|nr:FAD-dependent oxidoreductase [Clostridiales bacterium]